LGFTKSTVDPNLYYLFDKYDLLILVLYVDDMILIGSVTTQIVLNDKSPNPQGTIQVAIVRKITTITLGTYPLHYMTTLLWPKGLSLVGVLKLSNEAQGEVESSLSKTMFWGF